MSDVPTFEQLYREAELQLELEQNHSDKLADHLTMIQNWAHGETLHIVAVMGTNITVGDLVDGMLARHREMARERGA